MPVFWHLDPVWRNQAIVSALLLLFCPWPLIPIIYVGLLCAGSNDWDEDKSCLTYEEHLEEFFGYYGYGPDEVEKTLQENFDYRHNYIKMGQNIDKKKYKEDMEYMRHGKKLDNVSTWYDPDGTLETFFFTSESFDIIQEILDRAQDDWDTLVPVVVEEADVFFESLDYWYQKQLLLENEKFVKELRTRNILRNNSNKIKRASTYYIRSHLNIWLSATPFYERVSYTIKADRLLAHRLKDKPMQNSLIL